MAAGFGKYAHIAPTQVQQTRHQITYLFSQAIESLTDLDSRRADEEGDEGQVWLVVVFCVVCFIYAKREQTVEKGMK